MKTLGLIFLGCMLIVAVAGCNDDGSKQSGMSLVQSTNPTPISLKNQQDKADTKLKLIENDIEEMEELYDVAVIKGKEDILVAYKVKHLQRFRMKKIEKKINQQLEKKYPNENFIISSDYKIFLEAVELEDNIRRSNYNSIEAEKKLQEIIKMKKELT